MTALIDVSLGEYELEEPWGRLAEVGRVRERVEVDRETTIAEVRTYVLNDRTTRASSFSCKSTGDAVSLARFLDAHLAELRRWLLDRMGADEAISEHAKLRGIETDVLGAVCRVAWAFTTGDGDPAPATAANVEALHRGFVAQLAPVAPEQAVLEPEVGGGVAALAVCTAQGDLPDAPPDEAEASRVAALFGSTIGRAERSSRRLGDDTESSLRLDVRAAGSDGAYRLAQVVAAAALASAM